MAEEDRDYYTGPEMRILFGRPGRPIGRDTLRNYRLEGVGPLLGDVMKTRLPFEKINERVYRYPRKQVDLLLFELRRVAQTKL